MCVDAEMSARARGRVGGERDVGLEETADADALVGGQGRYVRRHTNPLMVFSETTVGFFGRSLWALRDTLMGLFVV